LTARAGVLCAAVGTLALRGRTGHGYGVLLGYVAARLAARLAVARGWTTAIITHWTAGSHSSSWTTTAEENGTEKGKTSNDTGYNYSNHLPGLHVTHI